MSETILPPDLQEINDQIDRDVEEISRENQNNEDQPKRLSDLKIYHGSYGAITRKGISKFDAF